ncbi:hypothetical protein HK100_001043 [Physocladia obscura]|uniref:Tyrosine phosphatase n=1 Tax=Physocladia obscura TaxID=109957 RepID=A0AAD5XGG4_9FUNG|nr:hypothetical protein HK100_001043 [Physocladia obscura]
MSQYPPFRFGIVAASSDDSGQTPTEASATELVARGAYPLPNNIRFLSRLKLRTIISLTPDVPTFHHPASPVETIINANATITNTIITSTAIATPDAVRDWVLTESIATVYVRVDAPTDDNEIPLSFKQAALILAHLTNPDSLPAYVHCLSGGVVTGLVCALLRKLMCWSQKSIMGKEYHMPLLFLIFDAAEYARFMAGEEIEGTGVYEFVERYV